MKRFLAALSILAFLLIAGPVKADWTSDVNITGNTNFIGANFSGEYGVVTLKYNNGDCIQYKIVNEEIVATKVCGAKDWKDFTKK